MESMKSTGFDPALWRAIVLFVLLPDSYVLVGLLTAPPYGYDLLALAYPITALLYVYLLTRPPVENSILYLLLAVVILGMILVLIVTYHPRDTVKMATSIAFFLYAASLCRGAAGKQRSLDMYCWSRNFLGAR